MPRRALLARFELPSQARCEPHPIGLHRTRPRARLGWFRTKALPRPECLPSARSSILRSRWVCARSLSRLLALAPHPSRPLRIGPPRPWRDRRMRLPRRSMRLASRRASLATGKMRLPDFCNRPHDTSTLRTARFSNHRPPRLSPRSAASADPPGPEPRWRRDRVEPRLTTSLQL